MSKVVDGDDIVELKIGQKVHTDDGFVGEVEHISNGIVTVRLDDGSVVYRYVKQVRV